MADFKGFIPPNVNKVAMETISPGKLAGKAPVRVEGFTDILAEPIVYDEDVLFALLDFYDKFESLDERKDARLEIETWNGAVIFVPAHRARIAHDVMELALDDWEGADFGEPFWAGLLSQSSGGTIGESAFVMNPRIRVPMPR